MPYDDSDLKEIRQEFADDTKEWQDIREEGATDTRYVAGDPWDPNDRKAREDCNRPCLSLDELGQYVNQGINELRMNKRSVKFTPIGDGATDDSAKFYENKMREIDYRSRAQIAYLTAAENMFQRSYGFCRVNVRYEHARSTNQDIWIDPVHNPDLITPDPTAQMPDMSDMKRCWVREPWTIEDFNARWPDYKLKGRAIADFSRDASTWISDRQVWVSERWKIRTKKRELFVIQPRAQAQPGSVLGLQQGQPPPLIAKFKDELDADPQSLGDIVDTREVDDQSVYHCLTNGIEILEETDWKGKYIPIVSCVGKVLFVDLGVGAKRQILSLVRLARDPFMAYCFYRTCEMENVGMTTKNPYWAYEGQLDAQQMQDIAKSMHEPMAVLLAKAVTAATGPNILPHPVRNVSEPAIQALSMGAEEMRRAVQAAMAQSPLPTSAQRRNEKSGIALQRIEESGQKGSFHFRDHYEDMITHVGVICEDLIDKIYDSPRKVGIRKANDTAEIVPINTPGDPKSVSTQGSHLVTISTGPSFDSEREAANDFSDTLVQNIQIIAQVAGPKAAAAILAKSIKLKNLGPVGDEMVEIIEPPEYKQGEQAQLPPQVQAALTGLQQENQSLKQQMALDMAKQRATLEKAKIDASNALMLQKMKDATAIAVAKINAMTKGVIADNEAAIEAIALDHESEQADLDRAHELAMGEVGHEQALAQGQQAHQQALEQGDQGIGGTLAAQQQQAELTPPAAETGA
jgi:hypothetical protein